jgi:hypothetical protein
MLYLFTVEYEIQKNQLIVSSFFIRKKIYRTKDILQIRDDGNYYLFGKIPFGLSTVIIDFKNGKELTIVGLKDHFSFLQELQRISAN